MRDLNCSIQDVTNARIQAREQIVETNGKCMTRKPTARPREMSVGTVREFERDQAVLAQQTLAKARRVRVAQLLPPIVQPVDT